METVLSAAEWGPGVGAEQPLSADWSRNASDVKSENFYRDTNRDGIDLSLSHDGRFGAV